MSGPTSRRTGPRVFGVGAAKTGTHTIGEMFEGIVPTAHECDAEDLIRLVLERNATGSDKLIERLRARDGQRGLKIDASQVNIYLIQELEQLFPDSRYILTLRPPLQWLRSFVDHSLGNFASDTWIRFRNFRFGLMGGHPPQEVLLADRGLYTLTGYLNHWRDAVERVIAAVVQTTDIGVRADEIAAFCGISLQGRVPKTTHAFLTPHHFLVLDKIDRNYLLATCEAIVGETVRRVLPGWSAKVEATELFNATGVLSE